MSRSVTKSWSRTVHRLLYGLGVVLIVGLIVETGPQTILKSLQDVNVWNLLWSQIAFTGILLFGGFRWACLVKPVAPGASSGAIVGAHLSNSLLSGMTPARTGEALAPLLMKERGGVPVSVGMAAILIDRIFDASALAAAMLYSAYHFAHSPRISTSSEILSSELSVQALILTLTLGALAIGVGIGVVLGMARWLSGSLLSDSEEHLEDEPEHVSVARQTWSHFRGWVRGLILAVGQAMSTVGKPSIFAQLTVLTLATWAAQFVYTYFLIQAFLPIRVDDSVACHTVSAAAGLLSMIPGGLGAATLGYVWAADLLGYAWQPIASAGVVGLILAYAMRLVAAMAADTWAGR